MKEELSITEHLSGDCINNFFRISCEEYWNPENEEDRALNLPNFIDIIGLDVQLSNPDEEETVNNQIMGLIIKGKLPENCDLLDLGKKLKAGKKIKERPEVEMLTIDIIVVVISAEDFNIPHNLLEEIYAEANVKTRSKFSFGFWFVCFFFGFSEIYVKKIRSKLFAEDLRGSLRYNKNTRAKNVLSYKSLRTYIQNVYRKFT